MKYTYGRWVYTTFDHLDISADHSQIVYSSKKVLTEDRKFINQSFVLIFKFGSAPDMIFKNS